jgi:hypothetical protein
VTRQPARRGTVQPSDPLVANLGRSRAGADGGGAPRHMSHQPWGQPGVASHRRPSHPDAALAGKGSREGEGCGLVVVEEAEERGTSYGRGGRR